MKLWSVSDDCAGLSGRGCGRSLWCLFALRIDSARNLFRRFRLCLHLRAIMLTAVAAAAAPFGACSISELTPHATRSADSGFASICGHSHRGGRGCGRSLSCSQVMSARRRSLRNHRRGSQSERRSNDGTIQGLRSQPVPKIPALPPSAGTHIEAVAAAAAPFGACWMRVPSCDHRSPYSLSLRYSVRSPMPSICAACSRLPAVIASVWRIASFSSLSRPTPARPARDCA